MVNAPTGNGSWFFTGSKLFFSLYVSNVLGVIVAKSWWKWGLKMAKLLKKEETEFFKASPQYFGKKLRIFATGNGNGVQNCLKTMFFEKKHAPFGKKFEIYKIFSPKNRKWGFYCIFMWQYFQFSSKISKKIFLLEAKIQPI